MIPAENRRDLGLLFLRVLTSGTLIFDHGLSKLTSLPGILEHFPNPIGVGSAPSAILAIFAEFVCAALVMLGIFTRLALIPMIIVMLVAVFIVHGSDPFPDKEKAVLYLVVFIGLFFTGGGRYVLDRTFLGNKK
jgi:putative oxidoreductase